MFVPKIRNPIINCEIQVVIYIFLKLFGIKVSRKEEVRNRAIASTYNE